MFLKSLELNGFKSFAQKTVLEFPEGITAIVGPNGSGKSNVIDAIRWLLGEREAKNLRGAKTEDLIFNGTQARARLSLAQAGLHFDNHSGFFPVDFKEVAVMRRISRDGASQYFLNKAEVRLKDIIDFFSRSRLGTKGLIIINQGNSDLFVRVTPEERRVMIEEILGLREYQLKKSEAERKLKNTFFNLEKVQSMVDEVLPRLKLLNRQAHKWAKRAELETQLRELETGYFAYKIKELETQKTHHETTLHRHDAELQKKKKELAHAEHELKEIENAKEDEGLHAIKKEENNLLDARAALQKEVGRLEAKYELQAAAKTTVQFRSEELLRLIQDIRKTITHILTGGSVNITQELEALSETIETFLNREGGVRKEEKEDLEMLKKEVTEKMRAIEHELLETRKKEEAITANLEGFNNRFRKAFDIMKEKRDDLMREEQKKSEVNLEHERVLLKLQDIESHMAQVGRSRREIEALGNVPHYSHEELQKTEHTIAKVRAEFLSIGEIDESLMKEAQEVQQHYEFLTTQSKDLEIAAADLRKLIKELQQKIHSEFTESVKKINEQFNNFFHVMFGGGSAKLKIVRETKKQEELEEHEEKGPRLPRVRQPADLRGESALEETEEMVGIEVELHIPRKRITSLEVLSGGEKSLVSIAALFALISVSPPPFLVLDEIDAALDESNSRRFANLVKEFSKKTQFIIVTHNRTTMEVADILYGVTVGSDGTSKILSLKLEDAPAKS